MVQHLPSKAGVAKIVRVELKPDESDRLDQWIAKLDEPRPDSEQAIRMIVSSFLDASNPPIPISRDSHSSVVSELTDEMDCSRGDLQTKS